MKLKIEGTEVVIDWGAQTVAIRKAPEAGEFAAAKGGPEEKPVYGWVQDGGNEPAKNLMVNGVEMPDYYVWRCEPALFQAYPSEVYYPTRAEAEAAVIAQYEADYA